jgi:adenylate kinase family enzyme
MKRVLVLGPAGAGKTRLARELGERTGLPVVYLDTLFWRPGWTRPDLEEWRATLTAVVRGERWILDGSYLSSDCGRSECADTIVFLDRSRLLCIWRVVWRALRDRRRRRVDLPEGCDEEIDLELIRWIWRYPRDEKPRVLAWLGRPGVRTVHLRSARDVRTFLSEPLTQRGASSGGDVMELSSS